MENFREHLPQILKMQPKVKNLLANPQIDWTAIYQANQNQFFDSNGTIT
jgi:hypothetical protein